MNVKLYFNFIYTSRGQHVTNITLNCNVYALTQIKTSIVVTGHSVVLITVPRCAYYPLVKSKTGWNATAMWVLCTFNYLYIRTLP